LHLAFDEIIPPANSSQDELQKMLSPTMEQLSRRKKEIFGIQPSDLTNDWKVAKAFGRIQINARSRNLEFHLTYEEFLQFISNNCFYCDRKAKDIHMGLDRIDSKKHYTKDNVHSCCSTCN